MIVHQQFTKKLQIKYTYTFIQLSKLFPIHSMQTVEDDVAYRQKFETTIQDEHSGDLQIVFELTFKPKFATALDRNVFHHVNMVSSGNTCLR